jgi:pimeloyl-ACP methyl ester carboxylesterase
MTSHAHVTVDRFPGRGPVPVREPRSAARAVLGAARRANVRTARFAVNATLHNRARRFARHDLARPSWNPLRTAHAALDELVMVYFEALSSPMPADEFLRVEREVDEMVELWRDLGYDRDPLGLHDDPPPPDDAVLGHATFSGLEGERLVFSSGWEPHERAPGRAAWLDHPMNVSVHATILRHDDHPRPWLVLVHGADMGRTFDARILRASRLHERLGVNVIMPVLPAHGPRGHMPKTRTRFPSDDHVANVHGLTQAVWDVRRTIAWVRTQEPTSIGVYGFSLGGGVGSLLACTEPELDALVLGCPAADLVDLIRINTRSELRDQPRMTRLIDKAFDAAAPVSAFQLEPVVPVERIAMMSAHADRLADPVFQVGRLWHHLGRPELRGVGEPADSA